MERKRIANQTSMTAQWTCLARAVAALEPDPPYHGPDYLAPRLLPAGLAWLLRLAPARRFFRRMGAPGIHEYVLARTKFIDAACQRALAEGFSQVLILGAGFDTRSFRFTGLAPGARFFELDVAATQEAKRGQLRKRGLAEPPTLAFVAQDLEENDLAGRLVRAGFAPGRTSLFLAEGLFMYLEPPAVDRLFHQLRDLAGPGSRLVFDYVHGSVLGGGNRYHGQADILARVAKAGEKWRFGIAEGTLETFLAARGWRLQDQMDAAALEAAYFQDDQGRSVGRVNGVHALAIAQRM